jgi:hypothetical protein
MHGISSAFNDTFTSANNPGQTILTPNKSPNAANPVHSHLISSFTSSAVTGAGAQLTFDVQVNGVFVDSGTPPVAIVGSVSGQIHGILNHQIVTAVRVRSSGITGGSCAVSSALIPIS